MRAQRWSSRSTRHPTITRHRLHHWSTLSHRHRRSLSILLRRLCHACAFSPTSEYMCSGPSAGLIAGGNSNAIRLALCTPEFYINDRLSSGPESFSSPHDAQNALALYAFLLLALSVSGCVVAPSPAPLYATPGYVAAAPLRLGGNRGPPVFHPWDLGYYAGRVYYVWRPGHWAIRNGHRV